MICLLIGFQTLFCQLCLTISKKREDTQPHSLLNICCLAQICCNQLQIFHLVYSGITGEGLLVLNLAA